MATLIVSCSIFTLLIPALICYFELNLSENAKQFPLRFFIPMTLETPIAFLCSFVMVAKPTVTNLRHAGTGFKPA